jgi:hypothetical protein
MTRDDRDTWLDAVMDAHPTGMHFKIAWIISNVLMHEGDSAMSLMRVEREHGEACRRSTQRAIRWMQGRGLIRVEPGVHASAPRKYTLLLPQAGRIAA